MKRRGAPQQNVNRDLSRSGLGYYTGQPVPFDPVPTLLRNFLASLKGPPVARLAATNDPSSKYFGTQIVPAIANFRAGVNRPVDLEVAALQGDTGAQTGGLW
jgi:hypothetical protein